MKHSNKKILAVIVSAIPLLFSCVTKMKVKVDIFDRHALMKSYAYREVQLSKINSILSSGGMFAALKSEYKKAALKIIEDAKSKIIVAAPVAEQVSETVASKITDEVKSSLTQLVKTVRDEKGMNVYESFTETSAATAQLMFDRFSSELKTALPSINSADWKTITDKYYHSLSQQHEYIMSLYGHSIIDDPLASLVAQAPDKYWRKYRASFNMIKENPDTVGKSNYEAKVNRAAVRTFMGNADIAIKMDAPGVFVIKGVRLDADEAIKASFKVLNQGVKYLAYASGVPVNSPAGSADNNGKIVVLPEKEQNDSLQFVIENFGSVDKQNKIAFLNILFSQLNKIEPPATPSNADVKRSIDMIQQAYRIYIQQQSETD
jgi:hypothetical protein